MKHGQCGTPEYIAWHSMKVRCLNPHCHNYHRYGGRGITIHPGWIDDFEAFFRDVGPRPSKQYSLGRIDNNGNYVPGNVEWQTSEQQDRNKITNRFISWKGQTKTCAEWAKDLGLTRHSFYSKMQKRPFNRWFEPKNQRYV